MKNAGTMVVQVKIFNNSGGELRTRVPEYSSKAMLAHLLRATRSNVGYKLHQSTLWV